LDASRFSIIATIIMVHNKNLIKITENLLLWIQCKEVNWYKNQDYFILKMKLEKHAKLYPDDMGKI
jgi:hypothetical protein